MASVYKRDGKGNYIVEWNDHNGKRCNKSSRTTDKSVAKRIAAKLEADVALRREGVVDPAMDELTRQARRPIEEHLADYERKLCVASRTEKHIRHTTQIIHKVAERSGFTTIGDITADKVNKYASELRGRDLSLRTVGAHIAASSPSPNGLLSTTSCRETHWHP